MFHILLQMMLDAEPAAATPAAAGSITDTFNATQVRPAPCAVAGAGQPRSAQSARARPRRACACE